MKLRATTRSLQDSHKNENGNPTERIYYLQTVDEEIQDIPFEEIIFICSGVKYGLLELHRKEDQLNFRGYISRVALGIPFFFHSHTSFVVNINHIEHIDEINRTLTLSGGKLVPIAKTKIKRVRYLMGTLK